MSLTYGSQRHSSTLPAYNIFKIGCDRRRIDNCRRTNGTY
jgi:hypothetical protein